MLTLACKIYLLIHYTKGTIKFLFYLSYCIKIQIFFKANLFVYVCKKIKAVDPSQFIIFNKKYVI